MKFDIQLSHPAWVCGLKQFDEVHKIAIQIVTPCVGVWIETFDGKDAQT